MYVIDFQSFHASGHNTHCWKLMCNIQLEIKTSQNDLHLKAFKAALKLCALWTDKSAMFIHSSNEVCQPVWFDLSTKFNLFWHELHQEQTKNTPHRGTSVKLAQGCRVKLHIKWQQTGEQHARKGFKITNKQTVTNCCQLQHGSIIKISNSVGIDLFSYYITHLLIVIVADMFCKV